MVTLNVETVGRTVGVTPLIDDRLRRVQTVLQFLRALFLEGRIPILPVLRYQLGQFEHRGWGCPHQAMQAGWG